VVRGGHAAVSGFAGMSHLPTGLQLCEQKEIELCVSLFMYFDEMSREKCFLVHETEFENELAAVSLR
jgi:hypothetical protein